MPRHANAGTKREAVSVQEKLNVLEYLEQCDSMQQTMTKFYSHLTGKKYQNRRVQIYAWRSNRDKLIAASKTSGGNKKKKHRPAGAGKKLTDELELKIVAWVNLVRGEGVPISTELFRWYAEEVATEAGFADFKASRHWQKRFLKRHRLSMRSRTRQGQIRPEDAEARAAQFAEDVRNKMEELGVTVVYNADQTAVFFEYLPKKTVDHTGTKTVWVRCAGKEKQRCTVMLLADSNGNKRVPWVVLKTRPSKLEHVMVENYVERQGFGRFLWQKIKRIQDETGLRIHTNPAGWWNEFLHREWLYENFGKRDDLSVPVLLLLDEFSGHWTDKTKAYAASINVHLMPVPPGLTSVCQPADVSWMRPFKDYIRAEWINFLRTQVARHASQTDRQLPFKMQPPQNQDVCRWVRAAWDRVTQRTIEAGYRRTGIAVDANDVIEALGEHFVDLAIGEMTEDAEFDN